LAVRSKSVVWIEDVDGMIESSASSELYALLKRQDEKAVTERAYENPVSWRTWCGMWPEADADKRVGWYKVEAEN